MSCESTNYRLLSSLPRTQYKEKWLFWQPKTTLCLLGYSKDKVQAALKRSTHEIEPTQKHYDVLQVDEFHTFIGHKKNKVWLIYAYCKTTGEIVAFVWGKRDLKTALALKQHLKELKITYGCIAHDDWKAFDTAFSDADEQWG